MTIHIPDQTVFLLDKEAKLHVEQSSRGYVYKIDVIFVDEPLVTFTKYSDNSCCLTTKLKKGAKFHNNLWLFSYQGKETFAIEDRSTDTLTYARISSAKPEILEKISYMRSLKESIEQLDLKSTNF